MRSLPTRLPSSSSLTAFSGYFLLSRCSAASFVHFDVSVVIAVVTTWPLRSVIAASQLISIGVCCRSVVIYCHTMEAAVSCEKTAQQPESSLTAAAVNMFYIPGFYWAWRLGSWPHERFDSQRALLPRVEMAIVLPFWVEQVFQVLGPPATEAQLSALLGCWCWLGRLAEAVAGAVVPQPVYYCLY